MNGQPVYSWSGAVDCYYCQNRLSVVHKTCQGVAPGQRREVSVVCRCGHVVTTRVPQYEYERGAP